MLQHRVSHLVVAALAVAVAIAALGAPRTARAVAAEECTFVLGFKAFRDQVPEVVGDCLENERVDLESGDTVQRTTRGILVWRQSDRRVAFTDGYRTWVDGPYGMQTRLNVERFAWEVDVGGSGVPTLQARQGCVVQGNALLLRWTGRAIALGQGTVRNPCDTPVDVEVNARVLRRSDGRPLLDAPTVFVLDLQPNEGRQVDISLPLQRYYPEVDEATWYAEWRINGHPVSFRTRYCVDVGAGRCLHLDPWLAGTTAELLTLEDGRRLLQVAADNGVRIVRAPTPDGVLGQYDVRSNTVTLTPRLDAYSAWVRAAVLAHELQHAADWAAGVIPATRADCYRLEEGAFHREAQAWREFWRSDLPPDVTLLHAHLNTIARRVAEDPAGFAADLVEAYHRECRFFPE